jgi:ABC-type dipeptide/oligopeptide/nickel transport system permease subunit
VSDIDDVVDMEAFGVGANAVSVDDDAAFDERRSFAQRFLDHRAGVASLVFLVVLVVAALVLPLLSIFSPNHVDLGRPLAGPTWSHPLGYDNLGRNVFGRLIAASRVSLLAALEASFVALAIGLPLGLAAGYFRGRADTLLSRGVECVMAVPPLLLAIVIIALLHPGLTSAMVAIGIVVSPNFFRLIRAATLEVRDETYVEAARSAGASVTRIFLRHILPNIRGPLLVQLTLTMSNAIIVEAALSFIGLGVQLPQASWGSMLRESADVISSAPLVVVFSPGVMIVLVVLAFNTLGNVLRDALGASREARW